MSPGTGSGELLVVRHGQSTWNVSHRFTGQADPPLSVLGRRQAEDLARACGGLGVDAVVTSDLVRAHETGAVVAERLGLAAPATVADLRERWSEQLTASGQGDRVLVVAHAGVFVVLGQVDGSGSATETANADGRRVVVEGGRIVAVAGSLTG